MNQQSLLMALAVPALLAFAALVPWAGTPSVDPPNKSAPQQAVTSSTSNGAAGANDEHEPVPRSPRDACHVLLDHLAIPTANGGDSGECLKTWSGLEAKPTLGLTFVFVPDPMASALALETDRALDAVRLALTSNDLLPSRTNQFPWTIAVRKSREGKEGKESSDPGIWLFRHNHREGERPRLEDNDLELLFLIGESPTAGVSAPQFQAAVRQMCSLVTGQDPSTSPEHASDFWCSCSDKYPLHIAGPVFSGSVPSLALALSSIAPAGVAHWKVEATSGTAEVPNLDAQLKRLLGQATVEPTLKQLAKTGAAEKLTKLLEPLGATAILTETDTAFGRSAKLPNTETFYYSRNLLNLRDAYEADKDLMSRIFPKSIRPDQLSLHFGPLRHPNDSIPIFTAQNLAVSQQIGLRHFASHLHRRGFANLIIVSSDSLDTVFLARFFQIENPDLRIVVTTSDALLDREAGAVSLRGVLTYSQAPTGSVARNQPEFPSEIAHGIYRAVLDRIVTPQDKAPAVLSVVGSDGEWPLHVESPPNGHTESESQPDIERDTYRWRRPFWGFVLLMAWLTLLPAVAYWAAPANGKDAAIWRQSLILLLPFCRYAASSDKESEIWRRRWLNVCAALGTGTFAVLVLLSLAVIVGTPQSDFLRGARARYFYFGAGVSPLVPLAALLLAVYACVWSRVRSHHLQSYAFHPAVTPLPIEPIGASVDGNEPSGEMGVLLETVRARASRFFHRMSTTVLVLTAALAVGIYDIYIRDIEFSIHDPYLRKTLMLAWTVLFVGAGVLTINGVFRIWALWLALRSLLRRLEFHPIRLAFTSLPDRVSWTEIWSIAGTRPTMISLQLSADYLGVIDPRGTSKLRGDIDRFIGQVIDGRFLTDLNAVKTLREIEEGLQNLARQYTRDLKDYWRSKRAEGWRTDEPGAPKSGTAAVDFPLHVQTVADGSLMVFQPSNSEVAEAKVNGLKSQFIALQYAAFIRYAFMELRNLLGFVTTASSLLYIALNVYPFQPAGTLTTFSTFLFIISSIVVVAVFYQMDRDRLLSRLSNTQAGRLDAGFAVRLLQFGMLPTITFLATHYPPIGQALLKVAQIMPGLAKL